MRCPVLNLLSIGLVGILTLLLFLPIYAHPASSWITGAAVALPSASPEPVLEADIPHIISIENVVAEDMLGRLGVNPKIHAEAGKKIELSKSMHVEKGKVRFVMVLRSHEGVDDVVVYEVVPKNLTQSSFDLSSSWPYTVVEYDPVVRFDVGSLDPEHEVQITYFVKGDFDQKYPLAASLIPASILSFEQLPLPSHSRIVTALMVFYTLSFVVWVGSKWRAKEKRDLMYHSAVFLILALMFLTLYTRRLVVVSLVVNQVVLGVALIISSFYYGVNAFLRIVNAPGISGKGK